MIALQNKIEKLNQKNTYIKTVIKDFINIINSYKIIDKKITEFQSKMNKTIQDMNQITLIGLLFYKLFEVVFFFLIIFLQDRTFACCIYIFFTNYNFYIVFKECVSEIKEKIISLQIQYSSLIKESREKIDNTNTSQSYIIEIINNN